MCPFYHFTWYVLEPLNSPNQPVFKHWEKHNRSEYYFDGEFKLSDSEFMYYFTYEYTVVYYDHYIGKITADEMQMIKDIKPTE